MKPSLLLTLFGIMLAGCGGSGGGSNGSGDMTGDPSPAPPSIPVPAVDRFEPNDNSVVATTLTLPVNENGLNIDSGGDQDFFRFELAQPSDVRVSVRFSHATGDLDIELLDVADEQVEQGISTTDDEHLTLPALPAGSYSLRVFGRETTTSSEYSVSVLALTAPTIVEAGLFSDIIVQDLRTPSVFGNGAEQTFALASDLLNIGTAPAPGDELGSGTAEFRLLDANRAILLRGTKGPVSFSDNGGCDVRPDIQDIWIAQGSPEIEGAVGADSRTTPGCIDFYDAATNNGLDTPLRIGEPATVPDGDYFYELEFDAPGTYFFEPGFARANNRGAVPVRIGSQGNRRTVTVTGPIVRSGALTANTGSIDTTIGNGASLDTLAATFSNDSGIGRVWGVARNAAGDLFYTLWDDGSLNRDNGDGTSTRIIAGLDRPMVFDFFDNDDVVIADFGNNRVVVATAASDYSNTQTLAFAGFTINSPTAARVGPNEVVYVSNSGSHEILTLDRATGTARRVAGNGTQGFAGDGGAADAAQLNHPMDMDLNDSGLMVVADSHNNRLRIANLSETDILGIGGIELLPGQIKTLAGSGPAALTGDIMDNGVGEFRGERQHARAAALDRPLAPRLVDGRVYFADSDNHRLRVIDEFGTVHLLAGSTPLPAGNGAVSDGSENGDIGDGGNGLDATLNRVTDINVTSQPDATLTIDISDRGNYRVRRQSRVTLTITP